jgi:hypothetical protein
MGQLQHGPRITACLNCQADLPIAVRRGPPLRFCSRACCQTWWQRQKYRKRSPDLTCEWCGHSFPTPKFAKPNAPQRFCSVECGARHNHCFGKATPITWASCHCGEHFISRGNRRHCGCGPAPKPAKQSKPPKSRTGRCLHCGTTFTRVGGGGKVSYCSKRCWRRAKSHTTKTHYRRAKKFGARYEVVHRVAVFERDNWRCRICGGSVSKTETYPHPSSPTIDHVVPISMGGSHTYDNVRTAHARCNTGRGNRGAHQLQLAV